MEQEREQELEQEQELERELEQEREQELEQELERELEQEREQELEQELEQEQEQERMTPTEKRLAEIEAREKAATSKPWRVERGSYHGIVAEVSEDGERAKSVILAGNYNFRPRANYDEEFAAHARTDVPFLLAVVKVQQEALRALKHDPKYPPSCSCHTVVQRALAQIDRLAAEGEG